MLLVSHSTVILIYAILFVSYYMKLFVMLFFFAKFVFLVLYFIIWFHKSIYTSKFHLHQLYVLLKDGLDFSFILTLIILGYMSHEQPCSSHIVSGCDWITPSFRDQYYNFSFNCFCYLFRIFFLCSEYFEI